MNLFKGKGLIMVSSSKKTKVAFLSIMSNVFLIVLKVLAGTLSGSVSIISEAIHSSMDLLASIIAFIAVKISAKPADKKHPYGHGKIENVSGVIEGLLIFLAAFLIIKQAVTKILLPSEVQQTTVAIGVMVISSFANAIVSRTIYKVAKEEDSIALEADALHLKTDVFTSLGVALGLLILKLTGIAIIDPIVAIIVACLIIKEAYLLCKSAFTPLMDEKLSDEEEEKIRTIIERYEPNIINFHKLRTRKSGNIRYIDFHMVVNGELMVRQSHELSQKIENDLGQMLKNTDVNIHIEPNDRL